MKTLKAITYVYCVESAEDPSNAVIHRSVHEIPRDIAEGEDPLKRGHYIEAISKEDFNNVVRVMFKDKRVTQLRKERTYV